LTWNGRPAGTWTTSPSGSEVAGPHRAALPQAGHFVGAIQPYTPITGVLLTHAGGDLAATQAANADVHAKLLTLLAAQ
jgi:hypothetical protein